MAQNEGERDKFEQAALRMDTFDGFMDIILKNREAWVLISPGLMEGK